MIDKPTSNNDNKYQSNLQINVKIKRQDQFFDINISYI